MPSRADEQFAGASPHSDRVVTVLSVSGSDSDHLSLGHLFRHTNWTLIEAGSCADAITKLQSGTVPVVICNCTLPDGGWQDLLRAISGLPAPPLLIVTSRLADDGLWSEVMNSGAFDVLEKPFNHSELVRVVSLAWLAWKDQRQRERPAGSSR